jgi:peptide/nickel transport system substrate-binding protein
VDALLDTALKSTDRKVREKAYQDAARLVVEDAAGVWIYNTKYFGPWAKTLEGIRFSPTSPRSDMVESMTSRCVLVGPRRSVAG